MYFPGLELCRRKHIDELNLFFDECSKMNLEIVGIKNKIW